MTFRLALAALATAAAALFHNHLVKSAPNDGEKLATAPTEVRLWFNERPEIPFTSITLLTSDSTRIASIKAVATADSLAVSARLPAQLPAGGYVVLWRSASSDGHAIRGRFGFTIAP